MRSQTVALGIGHRLLNPFARLSCPKRVLNGNVDSPQRGDAAYVSRHPRKYRPVACCIPPDNKQPEEVDQQEGRPDVLSTQFESYPLQQKGGQLQQQQQEHVDEYETVYETEEGEETSQHPIPYDQRFILPGRHVQLTSSAMPFASTTGLPPSAESRVFGWVMCAALLAAIRLSRESADAERMDLRTLQVRQAESRIQDAELRARRAAFLEAERQRKEADAAESMAQARLQAEKEAAARAAEEAAAAERQAKEAEEFRIRQEEARKVFFKSDSMLAEELERRTQAERRLREEAMARKKAEEEKQRVVAAQQAAAEAAEAAAGAEAARQEQQALTARQAEERRRLQALLTRYTFVLQGAVVAQSAPHNTFTTASTSAVTGVPPLPQPARLQISLKLGLQSAQKQHPLSSIQQPPNQFQDHQQQQQQQPVTEQLPLKVMPREEILAFASVDTALDGSTDLAGLVAGPFLDDLWAQLKADVGAEGRPALLMDDIELEHWRRLCTTIIEASCRRGASQVAPIVSGAEQLESLLQVTVHRAALPRGHPARINGRLSAAVAFALDGQLDEAVGIINLVIEEEQEMVDASSQLHGLAPNPPLPPCTIHALTYAHVLDRAMAAATCVSNLTANNTESAGSSPTLPCKVMSTTSSSESAAPAEGSTPSSSASISNGNHSGPSGSSYVDDLDSNPSTSLSFSSSSHSPATSTSPRTEEGSGQGASSGPGSGGSSDSLSSRMDPGGKKASSSGSNSQSSIRQDAYSVSSCPSFIPEDEERVLQLQRQQQQLQPLLKVARYQLQLAAKSAKPDQLTPTARSIVLALGSESHPIAAMVIKLAEQNMSAFAHQRLERRRQQQELETAAALLKRQEPQGTGLDPSSDPARRNLTPVPEQLWGLRNLANKMVFYDNALEITEALGWLRDACEMAAEYYGPSHPSQLGPLLDYQAALQVAINAAGESDRQTEMQELVATRLVVSNKIVELVQLVGERYIQQQDFFSVVILYEATLKGLGRLLPEDHPGMADFRQQARELMLSAISPAEARVVSRKRSDAKTALQVLAQGFTADLRVFALRKPGTSFPEQWKKGLPLPSLR